MGIKNNQLAYNVLRNFVANMILEQVSDKSKKINYEQIIKEIVTHIMTFWIGYKVRFDKTLNDDSVLDGERFFISYSGSEWKMYVSLLMLALLQYKIKRKKEFRSKNSRCQYHNSAYYQQDTCYLGILYSEGNIETAALTRSRTNT